MSDDDDDDLRQLLKSLRLAGIAQILERELNRAQKQKSSYTALLSRLFRAQLQHQRERSLEARIKRACLPERWSLESFPFDRQPGAHAPTIRQLGTLAFLTKPHHVVFIGKPGVGKTGIASGILLKALENGHRALFVKAQDLFDEMWTSLADRSSRKLIDRLMNIDVLLIDELGFLNLKPEQSNMFFKLMEERYRRRTTIITTNLDFDEWYDFLGRKDMVAALLDRIKHHCTTIRIDGPSLRTPENP